MENLEKDFFDEKSRTENSMPNLLPGFAGTEEDFRKQEQRMEGWTNLIVFGIVLLVMLPIFLFGDFIFRTPSEDHFLTGIPIGDFHSLQPVTGKEFPPATSEFLNKTLFVILWGPWDDHSGKLLRRLWSPLQKAGKNPNFQVIPIAYYAKTNVPINWYEMGQLERDHFLQQKKREEIRLNQVIEQCFRAYGFHFSNVWWDPADRFRLDLIDSVRHEKPSAKRKIDGIGFPTILHVEHGIIRNVWTSGTNDDWQQMDEVLTIIAAEAKLK